MFYDINDDGDYELLTAIEGGINRDAEKRGQQRRVGGTKAALNCRGRAYPQVSGQAYCVAENSQPLPNYY